jgi:uncharacterized lipoprotein YddW (UPF0748 family)
MDSLGSFSPKIKPGEGLVTTTSGEAYYPSELVPDKVWGRWDPLAIIVREAHKRGLQVYPTMCVLACGDKKPAGVLRAHPDWALRDKAGEPMGFISSVHPSARNNLARHQEV